MHFPRKGTRLCFVLECYNLLPATARMVRRENLRRGMTWASMKQARRGPAASLHTAQGGPAWTRGLRAAIGENSRPAPSSYTARPSLALTLPIPPWNPPCRWR